MRFFTYWILQRCITIITGTIDKDGNFITNDFSNSEQEVISHQMKTIQEQQEAITELRSIIAQKNEETISLQKKLSEINNQELSKSITEQKDIPSNERLLFLCKCIHEFVTETENISCKTDPSKDEYENAVILMQNIRKSYKENQKSKKKDNPTLFSDQGNDKLISREERDEESEINESQGDVNELKRQMKEMEQKYTRDIHKRELEVDNMKKTFHETNNLLKQQLSSCIAEIESLSRTNQSLHARNSAILADLEEPDKKSIDHNNLGAKGSRIEDLQKICAEQEQRLNSYEQAINDKTMTIESLQQSCNNLSAKLRTHMADEEIQKQDYDRRTKQVQNLENVLLQFQMEQETKDKRYEEQIEVLHKAMEQEKLSKISIVQKHAHQVEAAEKKAQDLSDKLVKKHGEWQMLRKVVEIHKAKLTAALHADEVINKKLISRVILSYFEKSGSKRQDVLALMARMLEFSDSEKQVIGLGDQSYAITRVLQYFNMSSQPASNNGVISEGSDSKSLSDMWVEFLLEECGDPTSETQNGSEGTGNDAVDDDLVNIAQMDVSLT